MSNIVHVMIADDFGDPTTGVVHAVDYEPDADPELCYRSRCAPLKTLFAVMGEWYAVDTTDPVTCKACLRQEASHE